MRAVRLHGPCADLEAHADLTAIIGMTGKLKRSVFYEFTNVTSQSIAGTMDGMSISAIGELANMITGNATIASSEASYLYGISPPPFPVLLLMGASVTVTNTSALHVLSR
jgi:CheY-specific phosphatase CheX